MIKLIDFAGKIITPGDMVITIYDNALCYATVMKVCKQMLGLKRKNSWKGSNLTYKYPKEVMVISNELNSL